MKLALVALAGVVALSPGPAAAAPETAAPRQCFRTQDIRNHTVGDDRTLYLNVSRREVYRVEMAGSCLAGAVSSDPLIIRSPPGSAIVCKPIEFDVAISRAGGFASPCIVSSITRLTPEQTAALPRKIKP